MKPITVITKTKNYMCRPGAWRGREWKDVTFKMQPGQIRHRKQGSTTWSEGGSHCMNQQRGGMRRVERASSKTESPMRYRCGAGEHVTRERARAWLSRPGVKQTTRSQKHMMRIKYSLQRRQGPKSKPTRKSAQKVLKTDKMNSN